MSGGDGAGKGTGRDSARRDGRGAGCRLAALLLGLALHPLSGSAQQARGGSGGDIVGRVLTEEGSEAIAGARVELHRNGRATGRRVVSDAEGGFRFDDVAAGNFSFRVERIGIRSVTTPRWWVEAGDLLTVEVRVHPEAVLVAPLEVISRERRLSPFLEDFERRRADGLGAAFFTRDEIVALAVPSVTDLLVTIPGVTAEGGGSPRTRVLRMERALPGRGGTSGCPVQVFLDGMEVRGGGEPGVIDELVHPLSLEGVEVYRGLATVPAPFLTPDARCGVVAFWTGRGRWAGPLRASGPDTLRLQD